MIGPGKSRHCHTWLECRFSWNENLQRKQNWTAKSTNLEKILDKSSQFLSSEQPCKPKSLEGAWKIAGVEIIRSENLRLRSTWRPFDSSFEWEERYWRWIFVSSVVGDSQISLKWCRRYLLAAIQLAVSDSELYFPRCLALKRTGTFATESKVNLFILTDFKKWCFDVSFLTSISMSAVILRLRNVEFFK